jgi:cell division transport system permease protein
MKSIKNHIMFILPLLAILLGIESFMVFGRVTHQYGQNLKEAYTILVVTAKPMKLEAFRRIDKHIVSVDELRKEAIVAKIARSMPNTSAEEIAPMLPHFYTLRLDRYLDGDAIESIRKHLTADPNVRRVETFGKAHNANYNLYMLIRASLWTFVGFMVFTSLFLVVKQMEIWQLEHRERMQVMEIFGASAMMRSGVLFRIALTDAVIAALITVGIFAFLRYVWVAESGIDLLLQKQELLFRWSDVAILSGVALVIVLVSVVAVSLGVREDRTA